MMERRVMSSAACREMARLTGMPSSASRRMPGTSPTVETVMCRKLRPGPSGAWAARRNATTWS